MRTSISGTSKELQKEKIFNILQSKYSTLGPLWANYQLQWLNEIYATFKDHSKFLIIIFLIKKTLDVYSKNFVKLSFDEFYLQETVEVEKFSISEISLSLNMPKETTRRKLIELEQMGVIVKINKKIIIDRSSFIYSKPINSINRISRFLAVLSESSIDEKNIRKRIPSEELAVFIKKNFSYVWKIYYELQIPMMLGYKRIFSDLETFHIYGTCAVNQRLYLKIKSENRAYDRNKFIRTLFTDAKVQGLNAMSISDITGIPRATVIRKLKILLKKNFLIINNKKHYKLSGKMTKTISPPQLKVLDKLAHFSSKVYNLTKV